VKSLSLRSPHVERLTGRMRGLDGPLIQLWAWPGAGQQAVLDAITEDARFGQPLSLDDLSDEATLRRAVEAAFESGARWLVLPAVPSLPAASPESAGTIARLLVPGQRLLFTATRRRDPGPLATSYLLPEEFLLDGEELSDLWRRLTGSEPGAVLVDRLLAATDGWYRPLRLAAEAAAGTGGSVDAEGLHRMPAIASFLRHEVVGLLDADEARVLLTLSAGDGLHQALWREVLSQREEELRRRLVEEWGLAVEGERGPRLPTLLGAFLDEQRSAALSPDRRRQFALRLGQAELALGEPVRALTHLAGEGGAHGGDRGAPGGERSADAGGAQAAAQLIADLLQNSWLTLFADAELGLLEAAFEVGRGGSGASSPPAEFLARLSEILLWRRDALQVHLRALERSLAGGTDDGLLTALRLSLDILAGEGRAAPAPGEGGELRDLPPALRPLAVLAELAEASAEGSREEEGDDEGGLAAPDDVAAARLVPALERVEPERRPAGVGVAPADTGAATSSPLQALFERGMVGLLRRRPGLAGELARRRDLPAAWRRWLAALPPAALASESYGYAIQLLGKPDVRLRRPGGRPLELTFPLRRAFQVFAYLATSPGREATRDELMQAVWWDEDDEAVAKNFHPTLSYVRRALKAEGGRSEEEGEAADPLLLRRGVYRLNPRLAWNVDVVELSRRVEQARRHLREGQPEQAVALLQSAWGLYRGPLMSGWDAPWISTRRDELAETYQEILSSLGEVCERLDRLTEAMDACRAALMEDALQERIHLALMRIYARQGRRDLVRRQYERLSRLLSEELGVEPMAETTDAYHRLMA